MFSILRIIQTGICRFHYDVLDDVFFVIRQGYVASGDLGIFLVSEKD